MKKVYPERGRRILVAMSGGVDSSVAIALLKKQGYAVAGAYMKNFSEESWQGIVKTDCPWQQDLADAQAVCAKLGIEFRSFNFEKEYREKVVEYFFSEYAAGRTPNPDIMCNKEIKFGLFLEKALESGFDYIATGHYARIKEIPLLTRGGIEGGVNYHLLKGLDSKKDQSYFLHTLTQNQLAHSLFPIGEYTKPQVRALARKFGLPNAEKKDSQGICFVGHINLREFLKQRIPERVGEIVTTTGQVVGQHPGAAYFTIGQREGLGIGGGSPYYVVQKDVINNRVVVAPKTKGPSTQPSPGFGGRASSGTKIFPEQAKRVEGSPSLYSRSINIKNAHWINSEPKFPFKCSAKIRYQQPDQECVVRLCEERSDEAIPNLREIASSARGGLAMTKKEELRVEFKNPQFAPAPGQALVFYQDEVVLAGGTIV